MGVLISKQSAIDAIYKCTDIYVTNLPPMVDKAEAYKAISDLSPAIIRCKDCMWCQELYDSFDGTPYWMCKNWDGETDTDGFCHEAERRADE